MGEFSEFLPHFGIDVPSAQASALYETIATFMQHDPLTLDAAVLCLSICSRDPPPVNQFSPMAERIGLELQQRGRSYASVFRSWDTDNDGYLSHTELLAGLQTFRGMRGASEADVSG